MTRPALNRPKTGPNDANSSRIDARVLPVRIEWRNSGPVDADRNRLRATFDNAADVYHSARPDYPAELIATLVDLAELHRGDRLLEIGCGTGKAPQPLAERGFQVTCLELGPDLAAIAARNLRQYSNVEVVEADFDTWTYAGGLPSDLVYAATAWHWLDPKTRYRKVHSLLRPGGHLAFWSALHVFPDNGDPFFQEIKDVYDEIGEGLPPNASWPRPGELPDSRAEIAASRLFDDVEIRHFDWEVVYHAESYINLLDTFSGHRDMAQWQRDWLYGEIRRRLAMSPDGLLRRHWGTALHVAPAATDRVVPRAYAEASVDGLPLVG